MHSECWQDPANWSLPCAPLQLPRNIPPKAKRQGKERSTWSRTSARPEAKDYKEKMGKMQKTDIKNLPKWRPKSFKILSWRPPGASWAPLGSHVGKKRRGIRFLCLNLGTKIDKKSKKIDVKKALVLRYVFFKDFLRICIDFGPSKPSFWDQNWP